MSSSDPRVPAPPEIPLALRDQARALLAAAEAETGAWVGLKERLDRMSDDLYLGVSDGLFAIAYAAITDCRALADAQHALVRAINGQT